MTAISHHPPEPLDFPVNYVMPLPPRPSEMDGDEMQPVRVPTPLPDLLPRNLDEIKRMRDLQKNAEQGKKYVAPRRDLPPPYVNDRECDEFEDKTIDTTIENLSESDRTGRAGARAISFHLGGPSIAGDVSPVFENGMLYKVVAPDGTWYYYNDMDKYEMHINFTFGAKSDLEPGEKANVYVQSSNELVASLVVFPGETTKLVSGKVNGFKCSAKAIPLNDEKREILYGEVNDRIAAEIDEIATALGLSAEQLDEEKVLVYCEAQGRAYTDCDFRPCDLSLYRPDVDTYMPRFIPWHRPATWIPAAQLPEVRLFRRDILPWQAAHGTIGDTYFVSAVAALAEREDAVHDLFRHPVSALHGKTERALGAYWVTLNVNGWWLPVLLDDYLPATRDGPEFARCAVDMRRMWVALLEKAYAKVHGSYANIASGDPLEPLTELTGFPLTRYDAMWEHARAGDDLLFEELLRCDRANYLQLLCTPSDGSETYSNTNVVSANPKLEAQYAKLGLRLHHGYAVLRVVELDELGLRLLRVRNPWGTGQEWDGAWGKQDKRWEKFPQVTRACYPHGGSPADPDHAFWIEWKDAVNLFSGGGCCHVRTPWYDYRIRGTFKQGIPSVALEVNVADPTEVYLTLTQEDERDDLNVEYHALLLSVFRHSGKKEKLDATSNTLVETPDRQLKFNFAREVALRYTFVPEHSPYHVIPRIHDTTVSKPYVLGFLPDTYAGNGVRVEFKAIDHNCKVFSNLPSFSRQGMMDDVAAEYQIRTPRQPIECVGTELRDERLREFGVLEE